MLKKAKLICSMCTETTEWPIYEHKDQPWNKDPILNRITFWCQHCRLVTGAQITLENNGEDVLEQR